MPVAKRHINIWYVPVGDGSPQKPPSATYRASRAKYVPSPQSEAPRVPEASGWKPATGFVTTDSMAEGAAPWNAQHVCVPGSKAMPCLQGLLQGREVGPDVAVLLEAVLDALHAHDRPGGPLLLRGIGEGVGRGLPRRGLEDLGHAAPFFAARRDIDEELACAVGPWWQPPLPQGVRREAEPLLRL